ncbi:LytTR family DNA-binding domain-containing protein [Parabacteroides sp. AM08-6]|uniref:LytTR family DNA-binding domain-containing protein n=1 Tax=Parabacteroides sp. AM08-6 TaxID=2292053 RepID=UPI000EFEEF0C|nr:LytTR family DNA-binding domain-containing protein [Parabacteroides sp. AM08-6]RHJ85306.1 LytTR family transcriptional regulator [Parabacteroides sp. AM08-6]
MDIVKVKDNSIVYSYKGGLKISCCSDLIVAKSDKPFIWLIFVNEKVLLRISLNSIETLLQSYFVRISRQVIVNMHHVSEFSFERGSYRICLNNGLTYKVSERREKIVRDAFLFYNSF